MDKLMVVFDGGMMLLGRVEGNKLHNPRIVVITNGDPASPDPKKKKSMVSLSPLPFFPPFITLVNYTFKYPFPEDIEKNVYELYLEVTKPKTTLEVVQ
jgi:hypothetical protein